MSVLKGNYELRVEGAINDSKKHKDKSNDNISIDFERYAGKHLGGSIAFVMKNSTFLLDNEVEEDA